MKKTITILSTLVLSVMLCHAEVRLPQIFQSGMVLQRGTEIPVWGQADANETILVTLNKKTATAVADAEGRWRVDLPAMKAGGPYVLEVKGQKPEVRTLTDVWIGDVWLCSGQSNMETTLERVSPQYPDELNDSNNMVRLFHVQYQTDTRQPSADLRPTSWQPLNRENAWRFSSIGYFLGKQLQREKGVAQGIIESAWGGTPIEAWIAADTLEKYYPVYYRQTQLYQNDDFVQAQQRASMLADRRWQEILNQGDPGLASVEGSKGGLWTQLSFDDASWAEVDQYNLIAQPSPVADRRSWIGSLWLRQHIHISKEHAGKAAQLLLGTLYDSDVTYINGVQVGSTGYQYPPRRYQVPEGLLREGDNVIAIRFVNKSGMPYFVKEKPYRLVFATDDIQPLGQRWKIQTGLEMPNPIGVGINLQYQPSTLFNGMIHPMAPFAVAGVVWYQGESNADTPQAREYASLLRLMMANWRQAFERPEMPFVIIQLANFMEPSEQPQNTGWSMVREAQRLVAKEDARAELAVTIDRGETVDIHPLRKKDVAERVALAFERLLWNPKVQLSPEVEKAVAEGGQVVCTLSQPLQTNGQLYEFEVAGSDGHYVNAVAEGTGSTIVIKSSVANPSSIRYAWKNNPIRANVYGKNGLPMSPFEMKVK
jgi:sialate O-acetylesterase